MIHEMFPPIMLELQREIKNHPQLVKKLAAMPDESPPEARMGMVFAYCGMVVDGYYNEEAVEKLITIALGKLKTIGAIRIH